MTSEKRAYKRFAFPKASKIVATLVPLEGDGSIKTIILNVSQGGVGLAAEKQDRQRIGEKVEFRVESVTAGAGLPCLKGQKVRIKWVLDYEALDNVGIGCEFVDLKEECVKELDNLFS